MKSLADSCRSPCKSNIQSPPATKATTDNTKKCDQGTGGGFSDDMFQDTDEDLPTTTNPVSPTLSLSLENSQISQPNDSGMPSLSSPSPAYSSLL